jgi:hypothetical protein
LPGHDLVGLGGRLDAPAIRLEQMACVSVPSVPAALAVNSEVVGDTDEKRLGTKDDAAPAVRGDPDVHFLDDVIGFVSEASP